jgi:hypothetical protein
MFGVTGFFFIVCGGLIGKIDPLICSLGERENNNDEVYGDKNDERNEEPAPATCSD